MATLETNDLPDLDMLISAAENGSGMVSSSGEVSYSYTDKDGFDPDEYAGVVQWYNEQTQNLQQHYDTHLEYQKQKLAEENEAGLLEALQQSLTNFESDHLSDFACLSSSLDNPIPISNANNVINGSISDRISVENVVSGKPSMLKKLLLSPSNENYPKEIDSASSIDSLFGDTRSNVSSPSQSSCSSRDDDGKFQGNKKKKTFTELLKHMEAAENDSKKINVEDIEQRMSKQNNTTRLLNTKQYMKKYGSSPKNQEAPAAKKTRNKKSRVVLQPSISTVETSTSSPQTKPYKLSLQPKSPLENIKSPLKTKNNVSMLPVKNYWESVSQSSKASASELGTSKDYKRPAQKHEEEVLAKKARVTLPGVVLAKTRSGDHDYCEAQSNNNIPTSVADADFTQPKDPPAVSQSKNALQKVLKWEDYLRQVRSGTRSAPNSPTCSPKVVRGSARLPNNFMVVSLQGPTSPASKVYITTVADKRTQNIYTTKVDKTVPLPKPLRKTVVKQPLQGLQEFDEYLSGLKSNINSTTTTASGSSVVSTSSHMTAIPITVVSTSKLATSNVQPRVLSTIAEVDNGGTSHCKTVTVKPTTKSQLLQVGNNVRILQTSINSDKTINVTSKPAIGSSGQMLMIQVPTTTVSRPQPVPVTCKLVNKSSKTTKVSTSAQKSSKVKTIPGVLEGTKGTGSSTQPKDPRDKRANYTPVKDLKIPAMMANCRPKEKPQVSEEKPDASPTFKLVTSNKDGVETKSLILSGVTGQLKEILTLMAKQQAVKQTEKGLPISSTENKKQQQDTLERLLSVISALKQTDSTKKQPNLPATTSDNGQTQQSESQQVSMPSPLSLIHEIKQNFNKKNPAESKIHPEQSTVDQTAEKLELATGSVKNDFSVFSDASQTVNIATKNTDPLQSSNTTVCNNMQNETGADQNKNIAHDKDEKSNLIETEKSPLISCDTATTENVKSAVTEPNNFNQGPMDITESSTYEKIVDSKPGAVNKVDGLNTLGATSNHYSKVPEVGSIMPTQMNIGDDIPIENSTWKNELEITNDTVREDFYGSMGSSIVPEHNKSCGNTKFSSVKIPVKFSMARSMAAAEMLATDVIDDGTQEILLFDKAKENRVYSAIDVNNNSTAAPVLEDPDPAVITLEDAMASLENDNLLGQNDTNDTALSTADRLFCKLPSYFLTGKVITEDKREEEVEGLKMRGMKNVLCDPLINADDKGNDASEWEYNKLPHYFSSGKTRPNRITNSGGRGRPFKKSRKSSELAVKTTSVDETKQMTPQGAAVNAMETYFSKLPTYYTYGRPHLDVKTFNDDVADAKDDTVTAEILTKNKHERSKSKHKRKTKKKKKHKKHKHISKNTEQETSEKVLYSKIPSYYMSGRVLASQVTNMTCRLSPCRSPSFRSSSPDSLYYSSRSSRSRSRSRRSRSRSQRSRSHSRTRRTRSRQRRSLPYDRSFSSSRSSSRSSLNSDDESQRSWRRERRFSRRDRSRDRGSYDSTDEEDDKSHREREAWKERRLHQEEKEKKQQKAMEERRVVYVGRIDDQTTKQELRRRFMQFGNIDTVSLHFRQNSDNYGFVTFQYSTDAFRAIEEGNSAFGPGEPQYDICFGGRRQFCKIEYEDLDSKAPDTEAKTEELDDFDALLRQARRGMHR